jgi:hypothetical protein
MVRTWLSHGVGDFCSCCQPESASIHTPVALLGQSHPVTLLLTHPPGPYVKNCFCFCSKCAQTMHIRCMGRGPCPFDAYVSTVALLTHDSHISSSAYSRHTHQTAAPLTVSKVFFTPYNINAEQVQLCKACQLQDARQAGNAELAKAHSCRQLPKTHMLVAELLYKYTCWQTAT